jgi:hypothetical protein
LRAAPDFPSFRASTLVSVNHIPSFRFKGDHGAVGVLSSAFVRLAEKRQLKWLKSAEMLRNGMMSEFERA